MASTSPCPSSSCAGVWRALQGDLGQSIATSRPVATEVMTAVVNTLRLAVVATLIGFVLGCLFGFVAGYFRNSVMDRLCSVLSVLGRQRAPLLAGHGDGHHLLVPADVAARHGRGPGGSGDWVWDWEHVQFMILPAITHVGRPHGHHRAHVRALVAELLDQEFIVGLKAKGLTHLGIFRHVLQNAAPTALAVMGLQLGYLLGGSILIETVFSLARHRLPAEPGHLPARPAHRCRASSWCWPVLRAAEPLVDVVQTLLDPRIAR